MRRVEEGCLGVSRQLQPSFSGCCYQDLNNACEGASLRLDLHVEPRTQKEEDAGEEHEDGGDAKAQTPAHVALDVDDQRGGDHHGHRKAEVVPIEEAFDASPTRLRMGVELVGAER